eukprot:4172492-Prymnesium_polylepis.1
MSSSAKGRPSSPTDDSLVHSGAGPPSGPPCASPDSYGRMPDRRFTARSLICACDLRRPSTPAMRCVWCTRVCKVSMLECPLVRSGPVVPSSPSGSSSSSSAASLSAIEP